MFKHFIIIKCLKIVISPFLTDGRVRYLNHALKLVPSSLQSERVFWDLDTNDLKYRLRSGKYYWSESREGRLIKKDGGPKMEEYDELVKLDELKALIRGNNSDRTDIYNSRGDEYDANNSRSFALGDKKSFEDPIVEKQRSKNMSSNLVDPISQEYFKSMGDDNALSFLKDTDSAFDKPKDDTAEETKKEVVKNKKSKKPTKEAKAEKNDLNLSDEQGDEEKAGQKSAESEKPTEENKLNKSMLASNVFELSASPNTASNAYNGAQTQPLPLRGPTLGFDFELFPVFVHKLEKKMLIMKSKNCLTHDMSFKPCKFSDFWSLKPEFYWEVYKAEDTAYLKKIQTVIASKSNANNNVKINSYAVTKNCPNTCPSGKCESSESESMDSTSNDSSTNYTQMKPTFPGQNQGMVYPQTNFQTPNVYTQYNNLPMQNMQTQQMPKIIAPPTYYPPVYQQSSFPQNRGTTDSGKVLVDTKVLYDLINSRKKSKNY